VVSPHVAGSLSSGPAIRILLRVSAPDDLLRLIGILTDVAGPDRTPDRVSVETPLNEGGFWLDSADLLEVLLSCEAAFSVELDPSTLLPQESELTVARLMTAIDAVRRR